MNNFDKCCELINAKRDEEYSGLRKRINMMAQIIVLLKSL